MNEKETGYSIDSDACNDSILNRGGDYSAYYANVNDLRNKVRRMREKGTSTITILREIKEDKGRIVKTPYRTKMLTDAKVHASNALKEQILSTNPVLYKDYLYPQVAVFKTPTGDKQVYAKSSSVKVFSTLSALKMAFIGDTIDYLNSENKTETAAKTYTKNEKFKDNLRVFFE